MTTLLEPDPGSAGGVEDPRARSAVGRDTATWVGWAAAALVVLLRLPSLGAPPGPDEAGYLVVARQWHAGGSSLYGSYWVDRPPLLLTAFQVASWLGGLPALRLVGCAAAAVTVLAVAWTGRRLGGSRAAMAAAVVAAAMLVSPQLGADRVNGELLAAPFTALGVALVTVTLRPTDGRRVRAAAFGVGAAAAAAILVKQNMAEVGVFALVGWAVAVRTPALAGRRLVVMIGSAAAGAGLVVATVTAWTVARGTSPAGVFEAMYPFRVRAARVLAAHTGAATTHRFHALLVGLLLSAVPLLAAAFGWAVLRRTLRGPATWAVAGMLAFSTASIVLSGSYWPHYLVELVVPVAVAAGLLVTAWPLTTAVLAVPVVLVAAVAWGSAVSGTAASAATRIGAAIGRVARPGDTIVTVFGNANVVEASGLSSPYPYLWSLPARTLDPRLAALGAVLGGPRAPTWVVVESRHTLARLRAHDGATLSRDYRSVAQECGRTVFLHDGVSRAVPRAPGACRVHRAAGRPPVTRTVIRQQPLLVHGADGSITHHDIEESA